MGKSSLINIQKDIFSHIKKRAMEIEVDLSPEFLRYRDDQANLGDRDYNVVEESNLLQEIRGSRVIYFGDFHTFDQNSRNVIRILRQSLDANTSIQLGLELVHANNQECINSFLAGHLTELEFLDAINYQESWRFPWGHYRQIFEFAKDKNIPIVALNSKGGLKQRDQNAAKLIISNIEQNNTSMIVLFGEYHIVPDKLPAEVASLAQTPLKQVVIHQNLDDLYWSLAETDQGHELNVVKFSNSEFAIQSSPPWVKYESMLYWYDNILEDPEFDIHEILLQSNAQRYGENNDEIFLYLYRGIGEFLAFLGQADKNQSEDFNLYDLDNFEFLIQKLQSESSPELFQFYKRMIEEGRAFKLPMSSSLYCPNYSINQLSFLGGVFALSHLSTDYVSLERKFIAQPKQYTFSFFFQKSIIGFIGSKVINPYRKTDLYLDLDHGKLTEKNKEIAYSYKVAKDLIDSPDETFSTLKDLTLYQQYLIAKRLGYICAECLFNEVRESNLDLFKKSIRKIIQSNYDPKEFSKTIQFLKDEGNLLQSKKRLF